MQRMPDHEYNGFTIAIKVWPTQANLYRASFSVHQHSPGTPANQLALLYSEKAEQGMACETAEDANYDAMERAHSWIDTNPRTHINPWDEGDYRIYGQAVQLPDGMFGPAYMIERISGIESPPQIAVANHFVNFGTFSTKSQAELMGIEHGLQRLRSGQGLAC